MAARGMDLRALLQWGRCSARCGKQRPLAVLDGKSFSNPAGTVPETQASTIGRRAALTEVGATPANVSATLTHTAGGRPGDPDDTLTGQLQLRRGLNCIGESQGGEVNVGIGATAFLVIRWGATASAAGVQGATLAVSPRGGRLSPPLALRSTSSPYPAFPGVPRDSRCGCHPVTGWHTNAGGNCPAGFLTGGATVGP